MSLQDRSRRQQHRPKWAISLLTSHGLTAPSRPGQVACHTTWWSGWRVLVATRLTRGTGSGDGRLLPTCRLIIIRLSHWGTSMAPRPLQALHYTHYLLLFFGNSHLLKVLNDFLSHNLQMDVGISSLSNSYRVGIIQIRFDPKYKEVL